MDPMQRPYAEYLEDQVGEAILGSKTIFQPLGESTITPALIGTPSQMTADDLR